MAITSPPRPGGQTESHRQWRPAGILAIALAAVLVLAAAVVALLSRGGISTVGVQGLGGATTQSRVLASFTRLDLAGSNSVTVDVGEQQSVVVHADRNLIHYVTTRVVAGALVIGTTGSFTTKTPMSVEVKIPALTSVTLSGSGEILVNGIDASRLTVTIAGSGLVYATGTAASLDVVVSGSGLAKLDNLVARDVSADVAGSGLIRVTATASLEAAVPGSGAIIYSGNPPQVTSIVTGSGAVIRD